MVLPRYANGQCNVSASIELAILNVPLPFGTNYYFCYKSSFVLVRATHNRAHLIDLSIHRCCQVSLALVAHQPFHIFCCNDVIDRLGNDNILWRWWLPVHILVTTARLATLLLSSALLLPSPPYHLFYHLLYFFSQHTTTAAPVEHCSGNCRSRVQLHMAKLSYSAESCHLSGRNASLTTWPLVSIIA